MEKRKHRLLRRGRWLALLLLCICFLSAGKMTVQAADPQLVDAAKQNVVSGGAWTKNSIGYRYKLADGTYVKARAAKIGTGIYLFNPYGYVKSGEFTYSGCTYYATARGQIYVSKWQTVGTKTRYFGPTGAMYKSGWKKIVARYYYFYSGGTLAKSRRIGAYYVGTTGAMARSAWVAIGDNRYYFGGNGRLVKSSWVGNYYVGWNGAWVKGLNRQTIMEDHGSNTAASKLIIIGASRVLYMRKYVTDDTGVIYIAKAGQGYTWFQQDAYNRLRAYLLVYPNSKVVVQLGNNDPQNKGKYIYTYKRMLKLYPKASFYFMDALPGNDGRNGDRVTFNNTLKAELRSYYIGGYDYLMKHGFTTTSDGIHYTASTYKQIYSYILRKTRYGL